MYRKLKKRRRKYLVVRLPMTKSFLPGWKRPFLQVATCLTRSVNLRTRVGCGYCRLFCQTQRNTCLQLRKSDLSFGSCQT